MSIAQPSRFHPFLPHPLLFYSPSPPQHTSHPPATGWHRSIFLPSPSCTRSSPSSHTAAPLPPLPSQRHQSIFLPSKTKLINFPSLSPTSSFAHPSLPQPLPLTTSSPSVSPVPSLPSSQLYQPLPFLTVTGFTVTDEGLLGVRRLLGVLGVLG